MSRVEASVMVDHSKETVRSGLVQLEVWSFTGFAGPREPGRLVGVTILAATLPVQVLVLRHVTRHVEVFQREVHHSG